ncbi:MAG TPA: MFS transporter, partial [Thermoleophilaceae bacterium]|nr:MFS transporter [Thermoleophilaceae bacterium]
PSGQPKRTIETNIPARLDRLPWSRWHWLIIAGLGTVWILDGLEVTIVGAIASRLEEKDALGLTASQIGQAATLYVVGACLGALFFGRLTDKFGRKRLFIVTLGVYLVATVATAFAPSFLWFGICRFFTGAGIGGEYAAINSAIDELIPARVRGATDLMINGSYWIGTAVGAALSLLLLDKNIFSADLGWRLAFGIGAVLGIGIMLVRRLVPESPRWLLIHGRDKEAEEIVRDIEHQVGESTGEQLNDVDKTIKINQRESIGFGVIVKTVFKVYPRRTIYGLALFIGQAFLYNAIFFTYALVLSTFYKVDSGKVGLYLIPFAIGNFLGPVLLGRLFDTIGRRKMIAGTYIVSGVLLLVTALLFKAEVLNATTQTIAWCVIFFFASAGASAAYLTVSEIFPMESRAMCIAFFYAVGTGLGGAVGPLLFGALINTKHVTPVFWGYMLAAALMAAAGVVAALLAVDAEQKQLEDIATPITAAEAEVGEQKPAAAPPRTGYRAARAGRGTTHGWSPPLSYSTTIDDELRDEVAAIEAALRKHGPMRRDALRREANARRWGPGCFAKALSQAQTAGIVTRLGRGTFALAGDGEDHQGVPFVTSEQEPSRRR